MEMTPVLAQSGPGSRKGSDSFFGVALSSEVIQKEKPWHRQAAYLFAAGRDRNEVATAVEKSPAQVGTLMHQEWFQVLVTQLLAEDGKDITELFNSEAMNSLNTVVEIRDNIENSSTVRLSAALSILDRAPSVGKPIQRIETSRRPTTSDPVAEVERLRQENQRYLKNETN